MTSEAEGLSYSQWFALLALRHFSPERAGRVLRANTMKSLVRRELAYESGGLFWITPWGNYVERNTKSAPRS